MIGDPGPYMDPNGPGVWVPRTVPYLKARHIAAEAMQTDDDRLVYVGKADVTLYGFTRDCWCEDACALAEDETPEGRDACKVPAWHFEVVER